MNIIILGNGFDLAHGLPTTYVNFLNFMKEIDPSYIGQKYKLNTYIDNLINDPSKKDSIKKIQQLCKYNIWLKYFYNRNNLNPNWCDFESEIEYITKNLEKIKKELESSREITLSALTNYPLLDFLIATILSIISKYMNENIPARILSNNLILTLSPDYDDKNVIKNILPSKDLKNNKSYLSFEYLISFIIDQLNDFTKCFELYLSCFVDSLEINKIHFIQELLKKPDLKILNFNYTDTINHYYYTNQTLNICYIHGQACQNDENNLVLGINETENNIDPMFTRFRKYFQRFEKNCNYKYREWINQINHYNHSRIISLGTECQHLYIIGHSLTLSDKNILHELITLKGMKTTIYYHSDESKSNLMQNLAAILGYQDFTSYLEAEAITFVQGEFN